MITIKFTKLYVMLTIGFSRDFTKQYFLRWLRSNINEKYKGTLKYHWNKKEMKFHLKQKKKDVVSILIFNIQPRD